MKISPMSTIVPSECGEENFLDISLTQQECRLIKNYMIIDKTIFINGASLSVGVKLNLNDFEADEESDE